MPKPGCKCSNGGDDDLHFYGCRWFAPPEADPQMQAENMDYMKMLVMFMRQAGVTEVSITSKEIESMPQDLCIVMGPHPDNQTLRFRLMPQAEAEKERDRHGS